MFESFDKKFIGFLGPTRNRLWIPLGSLDHRFRTSAPKVLTGSILSYSIGDLERAPRM